MKRRLVSLILCLGALLSLMTVSASAAGFSDVPAGKYYATPVSWAVSQGITNGKTATTFAPDEKCTRAQIITFLWRAAGSPDTGSSSYYSDVADDAYYCKATTWATEYGIVDISGVYFKPNTPCTRAEAVEYIWRYAKSPSAAEVSFKDVKAGSVTSQAVSWAVRYGVTNGSSTTTFSPKDTCSRAQIVTFLHRYFVDPIEYTGPAAPEQSAPDPMELDPLPPEDYRKHPDWYMSLTPAHEMSDERLKAEYDRMMALLNEYRAIDKYISDSMLVRKDDLMYEGMKRR
ncbi:MAG: S-layer homology domain-containing protein [Oscillospiraceae bacterium]|nr:S-layer homology domain-containing protein [Oscillospiraceae bacterium]